MDATPELPDLEPGVVCLDSEVRGAVHALTVDAVLSSGGGRAVWADADRGHAQTRAIAALAPSPQVLRRIDVARGMNPHRHFALIDEAVADRCAELGDDLAIVVAPHLDTQFRDDSLRADQPTEYLVHAVATLAGIARRQDVPVLATRSREDDLTAVLERAAGQTIQCVETPMGPRFDAGGHETLVYDAGDGLLQTTLAFWQRVLEERAPDWATGGAGTALEGDGPFVDEAAATGQPAPAGGWPPGVE